VLIIQVNEALEALDEEAIIARVSALRPGRKCSIVMPRTTAQLPDDNYGGFNLCIDVPFDDGVTWILKVPYTGSPSPPHEMIYRGCESQVATYRTLHACGMLVPEVYAWGVGELSKPGGTSTSPSELMSQPIKLHGYYTRNCLALWGPKNLRGGMAYERSI
jgi:hypothetical protein